MAKKSRGGRMEAAKVRVLQRHREGRVRSGSVWLAAR